jgi:hypothetical protein
MVEQRIKSTVIRRRAVRPAIEEVKPKPVEEEIPVKPEEEKIDTVIPKEVKKEKVVSGEAQPKMTSSIKFKSKFGCFSISDCITFAAKSSGRTVAKVPPKFPIAERTPSTIYTSFDIELFLKFK